jgi:hypothetical protein
VIERYSGDGRVESYPEWHSAKSCLENAACSRLANHLTGARPTKSEAEIRAAPYGPASISACNPSRPQSCLDYCEVTK